MIYQNRNGERVLEYALVINVLRIRKTDHFELPTDRLLPLGPEAAEVAQVCAQAARLGVQIDAADAVAKGVKPEALSANVLADLAARSDAAGIVATAPAPGSKESAIVAAAKKSAAASR
ncbi:hypothetical protein [Pararhodobacter aggregans]|uniref:hypothetical protein n=1 Tax=Pararhodobacter aggregans TaxID=404875 RepID=UPI001EDD7509|nr:hypothetical protein [Pararhodobacter aggregans]